MKPNTKVKIWAFLAFAVMIAIAAKAFSYPVKMAFDIAAKKNPDNPKRCYPYVKGIIDKWVEER